MRISDWSSDVCSSDLESESAIASTDRQPQVATGQGEERAVAAKFDGANAIVRDASRCRSDCGGDKTLGGDVGLAETDGSGGRGTAVDGEQELNRESDGNTLDVQLQKHHDSVPREKGRG